MNSVKTYGIKKRVVLEVTPRSPLLRKTLRRYCRETAIGPKKQEGVKDDKSLGLLLANVSGFSKRIASEKNVCGVQSKKVSEELHP